MKLMSLPVIASAVMGTALAAPFFWFTPVEVEEPADATPIAVEPYVATWKCPDCTQEEQYVLEQLQEHTKISDRNALATIMGNIKQESNFRANICEGGA